MTAWDDCLLFGAEMVEQYMRPFFVKRSKGGVVDVDGGRHVLELQLKYGDLTYNNSNGHQVWIECKAERSYTTNLFLEVWSNAPEGREGWLFHSHADWLAYFFRAHEVMYLISMAKLKRWALKPEHGGEGKMYRYPYVPQKKTVHTNQSWGHIVPIDVIHEELGLMEYRGNPLCPVTYDGALPRREWSEYQRSNP